MRVFIAAELPPRLLDALAETSAALRAKVPGRYVGSDLFHITLAFLGSVENDRIWQIESTLENVCAGHKPIEVELADLGSFGQRRKATLWQGLAQAPDLDALATDIRRSLSHAGFAFDEKRFTAHITLMRGADLTSGELPAPAIARGTIDAVTLFESDLSGPRPVYEALRRFPL